jgi:TfoX/Sxy family transcriptional regulator of competence genes
VEKVHEKKVGMISWREMMGSSSIYVVVKGREKVVRG